MCPQILIDLCWIHAQVLLFILVKSLRLKMCCYSVTNIPHSIKYIWCAPLYLLDILISLDKFNHQNQCAVSCFCTFSPPLQTVFLALIQMWLYLQIILAFMFGRIRPAFTLESLFSAFTDTYTAALASPCWTIAVIATWSADPLPALTWHCRGGRFVLFPSLMTSHTH